jgi:hypothetical protein
MGSVAEGQSRHGLLARAARLQSRSVAREKACLKETQAHVGISEEGRWPILDSYREALGKQLLTPAPDVASVNWKRQRLRKSYNGVKKELIEKAIADDIAFLDAHPTRNSLARTSWGKCAARGRPNARPAPFLTAIAAKPGP